MKTEVQSPFFAVNINDKKAPVVLTLPTTPISAPTKTTAEKGRKPVVVKNPLYEALVAARSKVHQLLGWTTTFEVRSIQGQE